MSSILLVHTHTHTHVHTALALLERFVPVCRSRSFSTSYSTRLRSILPLKSFRNIVSAAFASCFQRSRSCRLETNRLLRKSLSPPLSSSQASDFSLSSDFISPKDIQDRRTDIDGAAFLAEIGTMDSIGLSSHLVCSSIGNDQQSKNKHFVACRQLRPTLNMQAIQSSPPSGWRDFE